MSRVAEQIHTAAEEDLPSGWSLATIEDLVGVDGVFVDGDWVESKDQDPTGDVRLIQLADIGDGEYRNKSDRFLTHEKALELGCTFLMRDDVLIARMPDPLGRACIFPGDPKKSVTVVDVAIVRSGNGEFNHRWLMYFINAPVFRNSVASLQSGSTRKRISRGNLARLALPVPPREQQNRIVAEIEKQFSRLDEAVANLKRVKANLKRYKASVLKSAVEGKLTEDWRKQHPNVEPASKLLERILAERRAKWNGRGQYAEPSAPETTDLASLPKSWKWATVEQLSTVVRGASPRPAGDPRYFGGSIPWITVGPITADKRPYLTAVPETVTEEGKERSRYIEPDTLLLTNSGATLGVPKITIIGGCINDGVAALLDVGQPLKLYLLYFLHTQTAQLRGVNQGAAQPNLNTSIIKAINVPLPPHQEQEQIVEEIELRLSVIDELEAATEANLTRADHLRQSILSRAFSGQLVTAKNSCVS